VRKNHHQYPIKVKGQKYINLTCKQNSDNHPHFLIKFLKSKNTLKHMVVKLLGIFDLLAALSIILLRFGVAKTMAIALAIYLIIKGAIYIKSVPSMVDIAAGIIMVLAFYGWFSILTWVAAIWLTQKGVISLFS